ncbi:MAG: T9SS type A sorting domain-containing protein [Bacteroidales bacterium]|jgi:hypothetical protein
MKKYRLTLIFLPLLLSSFSSIAQRNITIQYIDDEEITYSINQNGKLTFSNNDIIISQPSGEIYYFAIDNIRKIYFPSGNSLSEVLPYNNIKLYPNPSKDNINLSNINSKTSISIYNIEGKLVFYEIIYQDKSINISNLSNGIYVVKVGNKEFRLVKE